MKPEKTPRALIFLDFLALLALATAFALVIFYAPFELTMGSVQKVFYFHVAAGLAGMLGFFVATIAAVACLKTGSLKWDVAGLAGVEIGMVLMALCIVSGSIWARPVWNTWWTWDPRLTTVTIMAFTYIAFMLLRRGVDNPIRRARFSAIYAIVGFLSVPLTFFSARLLRTIHPVVFGGGETDMNLNPQMLVTLFISLGAFTVLYVALLLHRARLMAQQEELNQLQAAADGSYDWGA